MFCDLLDVGYIDAFRNFNQEPGQYTLWEYFLDHWKHNRGIRIDYFLVSKTLKSRMTGCMIDREPRAEVKPSDHAPIILAIKDKLQTRSWEPTRTLVAPDALSGLDIQVMSRGGVKPFICYAKCSNRYGKAQGW